MHTTRRQTRHHPRHARSPLARPAFTIVELLTSIFVIALILAILIVGLQFFFSAGKAAKQRGAVTQMKQAVADFESKFGFLPPLVRDQFIQPAPPLPSPGMPTLIRRSIEDPGTGTMNRIAVVESQHITVWIPDIVANNAYSDPRFSLRTLPFYLMGSLDMPLMVSGSQTMPIDGVPGAGSYPPNADGSFRIPSELIRDAQNNVAQSRKLTAEVFQPAIDPGSGDPHLVRGADALYDPTLDTDDQVKLQVKDSKGVAYRYYRWNVIIPPPPPLSPPKPIVNQNIPLMVGDASDAAVRGARYAIVGPGPNEVFGDEDITTIRTALGKPLNFPEADARKLAAADNIVEVGQ